MKFEKHKENKLFNQGEREREREGEIERLCKAHRPFGLDPKFLVMS
jgi:hypothetical protein